MPAVESRSLSAIGAPWKGASSAGETSAPATSPASSSAERNATSSTSGRISDAVVAAPVGYPSRAPGELAQLVEHTAENRGVAGSSPALAMQQEAPALPGLPRSAP